MRQRHQNAKGKKQKRGGVEADAGGGAFVKKPQQDHRNRNQCKVHTGVFKQIFQKVSQFHKVSLSEDTDIIIYFIINYPIFQ